MMRKNLDPAVWGPPAWLFIDAVADSYPENATLHDKGWMMDFLVALGESLPCEACRDNYSVYMGLHPLDGYLASRDDVMGWLRDYKSWAKDK